MEKSLVKCRKRVLRKYCREIVGLVFSAFVLCGIYNIGNAKRNDDEPRLHYNIAQRKLLQWSYEAGDDEARDTASKIMTNNRNVTTAPQNSTLKEIVDAEDVKNNKTICSSSTIDEFPRDLFSATSRRKGAILVHLVVSMYLFVALAILCDEYFVPSLQIMSDKMHLQDDVAGATLLAIGGSAPELFTSIIGVFITKGDIGIGTILGSAVFNILFVIGLCGIVAGQVLEISWYPISRDVACYGVSVMALTLILYDSRVTWIEALILVCMYPLYITLMYFTPRIERALYLHLGDTVAMARRFPVVESSLKDTEIVHIKHIDSDGDFGSVTPNEEDSLLEADVDEGDVESQSTDHHLDVPSTVWTIPDSCIGKVTWLILLPINVVFSLTIPESKSDCCRRSIIVTFTLSIAWIGGLTYVLIWMVTIIGDTIYIPDSIMGITLVAFGSSVPDTLGSIIVAKQGLGDMAVAHTFGSNVFDILLCLGLPWTVMTLIYDYDSVIEIKSPGLYFSCFILFGLLLLTYFLFFVRKFQLDKLLGYLLVALYVVFLICAVSFTMLRGFNRHVMVMSNNC